MFLKRDPSGFITHVAASPCFRPPVPRWMQHSHLPSDHGQWIMDNGQGFNAIIVDPPRMEAVEPNTWWLLIDIRTLVRKLLGSSLRHVHEPTVRLLASTGRFSWPPPGDKEYTYRHTRKEGLDGYNHNDNR